ncbi:molybdopterin-binding protein [Granulosicoccus sp.]|nr:molybdopterin-binding protein [Granulosicoccus sp.]MDB4222495.1 molybdopterin-binding protein [Granulosicoccus sp.]
MNKVDSNPTAAVLLIGNELLSGRTQDTNLAYIAKRMVERGIRVKEARVISDTPEVIVSSVNEMRQRYTYVFTTGGIGPTHDDITADCVAEAFGVLLPINAEAKATLLAYFAERDIKVNEDRLRMARIPEGASLVENAVSAAPGFQLENVFVFAGVPRIMQAMLDSVLDRLDEGQVLHSITVLCQLGEGTIASALRALQLQYPDVDIGSYPGKMNEDPSHRLSLVARGTDESQLLQIKIELEKIIVDLTHG